MKRDMELVRVLLLRLESLDVPPGAILGLQPGAGELAIDGYTRAQIKEHIALLHQAELVETPLGNLAGDVHFRRLTWKGHDFLDQVRDPEIWRQTKEGAQKAGGFSLELLGALANGLLRKQIEKHTGVELDL